MFTKLVLYFTFIDAFSFIRNTNLTKSISIYV